MKLKEVFDSIGFDEKTGELTVRGISKDTRLLKEGELFFIIEGETHNIFSLVKSIEEKPVAFVADITKKHLVSSVIKKKYVIFIEGIEREFRRCVDMFYPLNLEDFKFIGITGTNGKTTTAYLIYHLLNSLGTRCALIGTVCCIIGSRQISSSLTTPDYLTLRKLLCEIKQRGIDCIIMEVSSHSIQQRRIAGIKFAQCIFTNLSRDHLDYHSSMQQYYTVKKSFFLDNPQALCLINVDDGYGKDIYGSLKGLKLSYALDAKADYRPAHYELSTEGVQFVLEKQADNSNIKVKTKILGRHNILNVLSALVSVDNLGFSLEEIVPFVSTFDAVGGRLEEVGPGVFVDYAHTPDALSNALGALRESGYDELIVVFGCGGNRDRGKRQLMGDIASRLASFSFITSDNPRDESPGDICNQIQQGFADNNFKVVLDRKDAIIEAFKFKARYNNPALLIAGKGHENYQIIGDRRIPFNDKTVLEGILRNKAVR